MAWQQLIDIMADAAREAAEEASRPPLDCPNDGEPLREGPDGGLYCPWDGWRPDA